MIAKLFLGAAITAAAISTAAPALADPDNPFGGLCVQDQCSSATQFAAPGSDTSQAEIQRGLSAAIAAGHQPS
jgi:hypothetical protein